jgi:ribonucleoside-diphosphate reductase alpha chain
MRGADASAGTIKSGGATRRAAKMVVLDVDHPDIEDFVMTKAREEDKIRVLRDAGFDMDLGGRDIVSVQYQNANNSVRVTDEFMRAVEDGGEFGLRARTTGDVIETIDARDLWGKIAQAAWACADPGIQYDDTINDWHTTPESGRITASNPCSEYMHLDNSSCNLASLNLLKFLKDDGSFDAPTFARAVELVITAMDISICFADFPTQAIGDTTRAYRQLGIGYANLGALLMASGLAYDSDGGRALAASITSLMTGTAYKRSAELAGVVGPYDGFARNAEAHTRVMRKHQAANDAVRTGAPDGHQRSAPRDPDVGRGPEARRKERLAQLAGLGAGADRDHRLHDGLRHHRHRAGLLAGQVQEAGRRRLDADRQPDHPAGAEEARLRRRDHRGDRRVHRRARPRHRRTRSQARALRGLRLRDGGAVHQADGPRADDGRVPAVPVRRHLQDGQPAGDATVEEIADVYRQGWKLGLKALAVYRDNCKVGQPLADGKAKKATAEEAAPVVLSVPCASGCRSRVRR